VSDPERHDEDGRVFKLEIAVNNDDFQQDQPGELGRCMAQVAGQLQDPSRETGRVKDTNGNTVGSWWFEVDR